MLNLTSKPKCIPIEKMCDGVADCFDGSDEENLLCDGTNVTAPTTIVANVTSDITSPTNITQPPNITYPTDQPSTDVVPTDLSPWAPWAPTDLVPSTSTSETTPYYPTRPEVTI